MSYRFILDRDESEQTEGIRYDIAQNAIIADGIKRGITWRGLVAMAGVLISVVSLAIGITTKSEIQDWITFGAVLLGLGMMALPLYLRARDKERAIKPLLPAKGETKEYWLSENEATRIILMRGLIEPKGFVKFALGIVLVALLFCLGVIVANYYPGAGIGMAVISAIVAWLVMRARSRDGYSQANEYLKKTFKEDV